MSATQEISIVAAYDKITNLGKEEKETLDKVLDYGAERAQDAEKEGTKQGFLVAGTKAGHHELPHARDAFKNIRNSVIKGALKERGGMAAFIAWAWDGADAIKVALSPEPPIVKAIELGFFVEDVLETAGKKIIQAQSEEKMAEMMKDLDPVFIAYGEVQDRIVKDTEAVFPEADSAANKILPFYQDGAGADWIRQFNDPKTAAPARDGMRTVLSKTVLWNLEYLRKLRYRLYVLELLTVGFFFDCQMAADDPTHGTAVADYKGFVHPMRKKQFEAGMRAMYMLNAQIRTRQHHLYNLAFNLWSLIGNQFGMTLAQASETGEL